MNSSHMTVMWQPGTVQDTKKKKLQETSAYCVLFRKKRGTYVGSTVVPTTSSSLEMI